MAPYPNNVTVYPYNGYIGGTNPIVRQVRSLICNLKWMYTNQRALKHPKTQPFIRCTSAGCECKEVLWYPLKHKLETFYTTGI